jgi:FMN phosphatase YigB (HAD superfamily)
MFEAVLFDLDDTLMPDESAANEALVATAALAKQWHNVPPGDLKDSVRRVARRIFRAHPVVAPYDGNFDVSSWEALSSIFQGEVDEMRQLHKWARCSQTNYRSYTHANAAPDTCRIPT